MPNVRRTAVAKRRHRRAAPGRGGGLADNVDRHGFRANVGMVIHDDGGRVLWARRAGAADAWQFPQGGVGRGEDVEQALFRELREETGLGEGDVEIRACTKGWLRYRVPPQLRRDGTFVGQKQKWFLLRLLSGADSVRVADGANPEFDAWRWVSYWYPVGQVVAFKRDVYRRALAELAPKLQLGASERAESPC